KISVDPSIHSNQTPLRYRTSKTLHQKWHPPVTTYSAAPVPEPKTSRWPRQPPKRNSKRQLPTPERGRTFENSYKKSSSIFLRTPTHTPVIWTRYSSSYPI